MSAEAPMENTAPSSSLWTGPFLALNFIMFLVYVNMALFFHFFDELETLGLDASQAGMVIGVFSISVISARPFISPFLHPGNARFWLGMGVVGVGVSLWFYPMVEGFWQFMILRIVHGSTYVVMATAAVAAFTACVPPGRSGQAFGVLGVIILLPYAVIPPLLPRLSAMTGGYMNLVAWTSLAMFLTLPLVSALKAKGETRRQAVDARLDKAEIMAVLKKPAIICVLLSYLLMTTCFSAQFYFVASLAKERGIGQAGLFFTLSIITEISIRLAAAKLLDRLDKSCLLAGASLYLGGCFLWLALGGLGPWFFILGALFGLGWGVVLPLFGALLFDLSPPRLRAFNTNLGFVAFQGGFLLGPALGGLVLAVAAIDELFALCLWPCLLVSLGSIWIFRSRRQEA